MESWASNSCFMGRPEAVEEQDCCTILLGKTSSKRHFASIILSLVERSSSFMVAIIFLVIYTVLLLFLECPLLEVPLFHFTKWAIGGRIAFKNLKKEQLKVEVSRCLNFCNISRRDQLSASE